LWEVKASRTAVVTERKLVSVSNAVVWPSRELYRPRRGGAGGEAEEVGLLEQREAGGFDADV
jgi:hypothetical protein